MVEEDHNAEQNEQKKQIGSGERAAARCSGSSCQISRERSIKIASSKAIRSE